MDEARCTAMGRSLVEMFMEAGREEIRKAHAMEELAAVAREWEDVEFDDSDPPGPGDVVDSDFEET